MSQNRIDIKGQRERRVGAICGLVNVFCTLTSRLLLIPIILHYLTKNEFGLYQLIGAFIGYLALIDFGISGTLGRYIARYQVKNDQVKQDNIFSMCIITYVFLMTLISLAGIVLYINIDIIFSQSLSLEEISDAKIMSLFLIASICATVLTQAFVGVNAGHERYIFSRLTASFCMLVKVGVVAAVLEMGYKAIGLVIADSFVNAIIMLLNIGYATMVLKVRFRLHYWDWPLFWEVMRFAFWTFLAALVIQINFRLGNVLLGAMTNTSLVAIYAIALQINTLYNMLPTTISSVFLPKITKMVVNEASGKELTETIIGPSRYQFMLIGCVLGGYILFGRQFITVWAGPEYVSAWSAALFILIPVSIPLCQSTIISILFAKQLNRFRAILTLVFAIISGGLAVLLIPYYGLYGPAIATGLAILFGHGLVMNVYYNKIVGLDMLLFIRKVMRRIAPTIIFVTIFGSALTFIPFGQGWAGLLIRITLFSVLYFICLWQFGMRVHEKRFICSMFLNQFSQNQSGTQH